MLLTNLNFVAVSDLDSKRIKFADRDYRLSNVRCCSYDPPRIEGFVNGWNTNEPVGPFVVHLRDRSSLDTTIYTAIYRQLEEEVTARMNGTKFGPIDLIVN